MATSSDTGKPVAAKHNGPTSSYQSTNGSGMMPSITSRKGHCHGESRRLWQRCYDIMVLIEKMRERLCYLCYAATWNTRTSKEWLDLLQQGSGKHISVLFEFRRSHSLHAYHPRSLWRNQVDCTMLDNVQIPHNWRRIFMTLVVLFSASHYSIGVDCRVKRCTRRKTNSILHRHGSLERWAGRRIPRFVETTRGTLQEQVESNLWMQCFWLIFEKRIRILWKHDLLPLSFSTRCQPTVLKEWLIPKLKGLCN